jgi:signal transduction histidine kinase/CheY-like chemotaxis protein
MGVALGILAIAAVAALGVLLARAVRATKALEERMRERTRDLELKNDDLKAAMADLEKAHMRLAVTERLSTVGQLAAGVAHEINNPLAFVVSNLSFIEEELALKEGVVGTEVAQAIADAQHGAARVAGIVKGLSAFSRVDEDRSDDVDLQAVVEDAVRMAGNELRHKGALQFELGAVPKVKGDPRKLVQVFINLLMNAADALPEGRVAENKVRVALGKDARGWAKIEVEDNGVGMNDVVRRRVFDPFFTTKPVGKGTGLGLSICHGIVASMDGDVAVESMEGAGTCFTVRLPPADVVVAEPAPIAIAAAPAPAPKPARLRVLVVDDEPHVGRAVTRVLQREHDVTAVDSAERALQLLETGGEYEMILCDVMMPVMSGIELYEELARKKPEAAKSIVFLTGGAFTASAQHFLETTSAPCWHKPLDAAGLRAGIADWSKRRANAA